MEVKLNLTGFYIGFDCRVVTRTNRRPKRNRWPPKRK